MHVLFEEDGAFKAATIVTDNDSSLQVETAPASAARSRRRTSCCATANRRRRSCSIRPKRWPGIEPDFLWECLGDGEFSFSDFANEYFGHVATAVESGCAPAGPAFGADLFPSQGQGRFRKAPPKFSRPLSPVSKKSASKP
jgi:exoribonuclease-2